MRVLIVIALLFTFTVGNFSGGANASTPDHVCIHHKVDQSESAGEKPCHAGQDQNLCDDCCCMHSHSLAGVLLFAKTPNILNSGNIIVSIDNADSINLSGLRRPPRL